MIYLLQNTGSLEVLISLLADTSSESDMTQFESGWEVSVYVIKCICSANQLMLLQHTSILNS